MSAALDAGRTAGANESISVDLSRVDTNRTADEAAMQLPEPLDPLWGTNMGKSSGKGGVGGSGTETAAATTSAGGLGYKDIESRLLG